MIKICNLDTGKIQKYYDTLISEITGLHRAAYNSVEGYAFVFALLFINPVLFLHRICTKWKPRNVTCLSENKQN